MSPLLSFLSENNLNHSSVLFNFAFNVEGGEEKGYLNYTSEAAVANDSDHKKKKKLKVLLLLKVLLG